jgi:hypothetical protein
VISARYSPAIAAAIRSARARSALAEVSLLFHKVASPAASVTSSAIHSSRSCDRASAGSATRPSPSLATPSRASLRHTAIRGVDGSRGIR